MGIIQGRRVETHMVAEMRKEAQGTLQYTATLLDEYVEDQVQGWLLDLARVDDLQEHERLHRAQTGWFDAIYLWEDVGEAYEGELRWPRPVLVERTDLIEREACIRISSGLPTTFFPEMGARMMSACRDHRSPQVRLYAASKAAALFLRSNQPTSAHRALIETGIPMDSDLALMSRRGVPPSRLAKARYQLAQAVARTGNIKEAVRILLNLARDIGAQDGPVLAETLEVLEMDVLPGLRELDATREAAEADALHARGAARLAGFRALESALAQGVNAPAFGDTPGVAHDLYGDSGYLLFYSRLDMDGLVGAVQVDRQGLLDRLLTGAGGKNYLISDANGHVVAGAGSGEGELIDVPFRTMPHLRLGFRETVMDAAVDPVRRSARWPLLPPLLGALIGGLALLAKVAAERREEDLRERQREFTTRVTHELKTPLGGIRVMAENLELGAAADPDTAMEFAGRIVQETDRLTERVNEILRVGRSRELGKPMSLDMEALVFEQADLWEGRMAQHGVTLHAELKRMPPLVADPELVRDSLACLLDNALKYHDPEHPDPQVWVDARQDGRFVTISVTDNGIGIPRDMRRKVFERFARVEGPGRGFAGGHGLGLSFVKDAVKAHRGRLECRDGVDGGVSFVMRFPYPLRTVIRRSLWRAPASS